MIVLIDLTNNVRLIEAESHHYAQGTAVTSYFLGIF